MFMRKLMAMLIGHALLLFAALGAQGEILAPVSPARMEASSSCLNQCTGHGTCSTGRCTCNSGYTGSDCSQSTRPTRMQ